jgi:hypothetical protein
MLLKAIDGSDESRLAGTGRSEDDHHFALFYRGGNAPEDVEITEPLMYVPADNDVLGLGRSFTRNH